MTVDLERKLLLHDRVTSIYRDDRFPTDHYGRMLRSFAVAIGWTVVVFHEHGSGNFWDECADLMCWPKEGRRFLLAEMFRADLPRYEPPDWNSQDRACEAPMIRRDGLCGKPSSQSFRVTDWATGQWRTAHYCSRHRAEGDAARILERERRKAGNIPDPTPNAGGLLPIYAPNRRWPDWYRWASPNWEPPALGINRNDWPVLEKVAGLEPPKLALVKGGGESGPATPPPAFTVLLWDRRAARAASQSPKGAEG